MRETETETEREREREYRVKVGDRELVPTSSKPRLYIE
jgi:hypothetical protein